MKAIQIKFLPATNFKGARMKAVDEGGNRIIIPFQYELSSDEMRCRLVAEELIFKLKWKVSINGFGQLPNGDLSTTWGEAA